MRASLLFALCLVASPPLATAQGWSNYGGNDARNGRTPALGPQTATLAWENADDFSIISWHPFIEGNRVFTVREAGFPTDGGAANDAIVAYDLASGSELWRVTLPFGGDTSTEWIAWIGAVKDGRVYASRSSNLQPQPLIALDAATGATLWTSQLAFETWAHDGLVFAPDGDVIIGDRLSITRLESTDGSTVWQSIRTCPVSGNCGAAATPTAVFIDEAGPGGNVITKLDVQTGAPLYSSQVMPGFTEQNTPFLSPDGGTVYLSRTQDDQTTDFLYSFDDTGSALVLNWSRAVRWTTSHEHGIADDGSIYTFLPTDELVRLDPATGNVTAMTAPLAPLGSPNVSPKTAVDGNGTVYVSNNWASTPATNGRLWAFSSDLATNHFTLMLDRPNAGGPALAADGTLLVCDRTSVRAYAGMGGSVPVTYCTAKTSSAGCVTSITTSDRFALPVSGASDYSVLASGVQELKNGLVFVGVSGAAALPFSGGTLCVNPPTKRGPIMTSGGDDANECDGAYATLVNDGQIVPAGLDAGSGNSAWYQYWYRDPQNGAGVLGTALSDAVQVDFH